MAVKSCTGLFPLAHKIKPASSMKFNQNPQNIIKVSLQLDHSTPRGLTQTRDRISLLGCVIQRIVNFARCRPALSFPQSQGKTRFSGRRELESIDQPLFVGTVWIKVKYPSEGKKKVGILHSSEIPARGGGRGHLYAEAMAERIVWRRSCLKS